MAENDVEKEEPSPDEVDELGIDVNDIRVDCMDDPVLVNEARQMTRYENSALLAAYDAVCVDCVAGDKRVPGHEHLQGKADPLCKTCGGTGRIPRTPTEED